LKRFIAWDIGRGRLPHVIISEFGDLDIDGLLASDHEISLTVITGGCACCDLREELAGALASVVAESPGSTVFIESTGVGDPAGIVESIVPLLESGTAFIGNVIVVYDASRQLLVGKDGGLVRRQLETADTIVINKADLVSRDDILAAVDCISKINPFAEQMVTSQCAIDIGEALERKSSIQAVEGTAPTSETFRSFGFLIEEPLSEKALEKWLITLPSSVVRAKGFVELAGRDGLFEVQATRGQVSITRAKTREKPPAMLVLVSHPMRMDGVVKGLQKCVAREPA